MSANLYQEKSSLIKKDERVERVEKVEISLKPGGRHNDSDGCVSPSGNESPEFLFSPHLEKISPLGRHNDVEGGVSPSENSRFNRWEVMTYNFHLPSM
jgi:hypothetical protein